MIDSATHASPNFGFRTYLGQSWEGTRDHWFVLTVAAFVRDLIAVLAGGLVFSLLIDFKGWNFAIAFAVGCLTWSGLQAGYLKFCLNIYNQRKANWKDLFSYLPLSFRMLFAGVCLCSSVAFGLVLLVLPGLFLAARFSLYGLTLVDQKVGALKSLLVSYRMLKGFTRYAVVTVLVYCISSSIFGWLSLGFQSFFVISLCVLYEQIRKQEISQ